MNVPELAEDDKFLTKFYQFMNKHKKTTSTLFTPHLAIKCCQKIGDGKEGI